MVKSIIQDCVICKEKLKVTVKQVMSTLPIERLKPCPAFNNVGVDYFGPFETKGEVQQRINRKCYDVIIVCLSSVAVFVDLANDYSTEDSQASVDGQANFSAIKAQTWLELQTF